MTDMTPEEKLLNLIKKDGSKEMLGKELKIFTKINIALVAVIAVIAAVFFADVFIFKEKEVIKPILDAQVKQAEVQPVINVPEEKEAPDAAVSQADIDAKKVSKEEITANLNLLGIITGDNNQAIIEDKTLKKTFFLYKGDSLGELKIYDIKDSTVILDYKGEKVELKM